MDGVNRGGRPKTAALGSGEKPGPHYEAHRRGREPNVKQRRPETVPVQNDSMSSARVQVQTAWDVRRSSRTGAEPVVLRFE